MPILGSIGAGSARGLGLTSGGRSPYTMEYLVVAGGGAGGSAPGGCGNAGGGAGGFRTTSTEIDPNVTYTITVGAGGNGASRSPGSPGAASGISGTGITYPSTGGGRGASTNGSGGEAGGSGGGGVFNQGGGSGNQGGYSPAPQEVLQEEMEQHLQSQVLQ